MVLTRAKRRQSRATDLQRCMTPALDALYADCVHTYRSVWAYATTLPDRVAKQRLP